MVTILLTTFSCALLEENAFIYIQISINFVPSGPIDNTSGLALSMQQVITWTNEDQIEWPHVVSLGLILSINWIKITLKVCYNVPKLVRCLQQFWHAMTSLQGIDLPEAFDTIDLDNYLYKFWLTQPIPLVPFNTNALCYNLQWIYPRPLDTGDCNNHLYILLWLIFFIWQFLYLFTNVNWSILSLWHHRPQYM